MALMEINFNSTYLERTTTISILKTNTFKENKDFQVLYLLHGYFGDHTNWLRHTRLEKYLSGKNVIVVMPSAYNGFYIDQEGFEQYFSFLTKELYDFVDKTFNIKQTPEKTFIAGLSMGGYGAFKAALVHPEKYSKAAGFSSVTKLDTIVERSGPQRKSKLLKFFGPNIKDEDDLYKLADKSLNKVSLYLTCGTEDYLFSETKELHEHLTKLGFKHTYKTSSGNHNWDYWDEQIKLAIPWLLD